MRTASTTLLAAVTLAILAQLGVLACSSDSGGDPQSTAGSPSSAGATSAGGSGAATAGAPGTGTAGGAGSGFGGAGMAGAGQGGSSDGTSGSMGVGGANAGSGGSTAGSGGLAGTGGGAGGAAGSAGASGSPSGGSGGGSTGPFALTSPAFMNVAGCSATNIAVCDKTPTDALLTTIMGANHSPELDWTAGPSGTQSYAIVLFDTSNMYPHWAIWNIPPSTMKLPTALPAGPNPGGLTGVKQAGFSGNKDQYSGPGAHKHVYQFRAYALKVATISPTLPSIDPQKAVRTLLEGSADVLAKADLTAASP